MGCNTAPAERQLAARANIMVKRLNRILTSVFDACRGERQGAD
jgi:hypothetical protein